MPKAGKKRKAEAETLLEGKFKKGDKCFCHYVQKDIDDIFKVVILKLRKKTTVIEYQVHYDGWNKRYDEWVDDSRLGITKDFIKNDPPVANETPEKVKPPQVKKSKKSKAIKKEPEAKPGPSDSIDTLKTKQLLKDDTTNPTLTKSSHLLDSDPLITTKPESSDSGLEINTEKQTSVPQNLRPNKKSIFDNEFQQSVDNELKSKDVLDNKPSTSAMDQIPDANVVTYTLENSLEKSENKEIEIAAVKVLEPSMKKKLRMILDQILYERQLYDSNYFVEEKLTNGESIYILDQDELIEYNNKALQHAMGMIKSDRIKTFRIFIIIREEGNFTEAECFMITGVFTGFDEDDVTINTTTTSQKEPEKSTLPISKPEQSPKKIRLNNFDNFIKQVKNLCQNQKPISKEPYTNNSLGSYRLSVSHKTCYQIKEISDLKDEVGNKIKWLRDELKCKNPDITDEDLKNLENEVKINRIDGILYYQDYEFTVEVISNFKYII